MKEVLSTYLIHFGCMFHMIISVVFSMNVFDLLISNCRAILENPILLTTICHSKYLQLFLLHRVNLQVIIVIEHAHSVQQSFCHSSPHV